MPLGYSPDRKGLFVVLLRKGWKGSWKNLCLSDREIDTCECSVGKFTTVYLMPLRRMPERVVSPAGVCYAEIQ